MGPKQKRVMDDLHTFLMDRPYFVGSLHALAQKVGHKRGEVSAARSRSRSAEHISENKWEVGYVGIGTQQGRWEICDLSNPENCERSLAKRWPEVAEDCRRLAAVATLKREAVTNGDDLKHAVAEQRTAEAMVALAESFSR